MTKSIPYRSLSGLLGFRGWCFGYAATAMECAYGKDPSSNPYFRWNLILISSLVDATWNPAKSLFPPVNSQIIINIAK